MQVVILGQVNIFQVSFSEVDDNDQRNSSEKTGGKKKANKAKS